MKMKAELKPKGQFITLAELRKFIEFVDSVKAVDGDVFPDSARVLVMPRHVEIEHDPDRAELAKPNEVKLRQHKPSEVEQEVLGDGSAPPSSGGASALLKDAQRKHKRRSGNDVTVHSTDSSTQLSANDGTAEYGKLRPYAR